MPALISACKVTALVPKKLSSKMDLPLVVLESLGLQRPVVVTDRPPINEALFGVGGMQVPYGDISALSNSVRRLIADDKLYRQMATEGYKAVREHCSPKKVVEQFRNIYQSILVPQDNPIAKKTLSGNE
jgi:glycosyltransferase involved in cell wall biosynthesis